MIKLHDSCFLQTTKEVHGAGYRGGQTPVADTKDICNNFGRRLTGRRTVKAGKGTSHRTWRWGITECSSRECASRSSRACTILSTGLARIFSDGFAVQSEGPSQQMSRLPWSEEWCLIKL